MRSGKWYFFPTVLLATALAGLTGSGCRTFNGIDNETVIKTPYSLYFGDAGGSLYNTNDGQAYKLIFNVDGFPARAVIASGTNILMIKRNLALSADNGQNFSAKERDPFVIDKTAWSSFVINAFNKTFLAGVDGILESTDNGLIWSVGSPVRVHSFARLKGGDLFAIDSSGGITTKTGPQTPWAQVTINSPFPGGIYHLANYNDALIAADASGANGIWFSNNKASTWQQYTGIPNNQPIRAIYSPLGQGLLAGVGSNGIYRLVNSNFEPSNSGLAPQTIVYGITSKQDVYKNEIIRQYVYIATSTGVYRSEDLGQNWALMWAGGKNGDVRVIY